MTQPTEDQAGASAQREYERRTVKDRARRRENWGRLEGLVGAIAGERQSTKAWATGAAGERRVGGLLDTLRSERIAVLHDRRIPGSRANIDHLVIHSGGVWVIDTKQYTGRPQLRTEGGLLRPRVELLFVDGRNKTSCVEGVHRQVAKVEDALPGVPVAGFLCFVGADWGLFSGRFSVQGVEVLWPGKLVSRLKSATPGTVDVAAVAATIARTFRAA